MTAALLDGPGRTAQLTVSVLFIIITLTLRSLKMLVLSFIPRLREKPVTHAIV